MNKNKSRDNVKHCLVRNSQVDTEKYLTARDAAAMLLVSYDTLACWRRLEIERIPYLNIGSRIYYRYEDIVAFREKHFNQEGYAVAAKQEDGE